MSIARCHVHMHTKSFPQVARSVVQKLPPGLVLRSLVVWPSDHPSLKWFQACKFCDSARQQVSTSMVSKPRSKCLRSKWQVYVGTCRYRQYCFSFSCLDMTKKYETGWTIQIIMKPYESLDSELSAPLLDVPEAKMDHPANVTAGKPNKPRRDGST